MILIDTNYLVDIFILPINDAMEMRRNQALSLLSMIERNNVRAILPEVVIHESFYVLTIRLKVQTTAEFAGAFRSILTYPGWSMSLEEISILSRGLDIVELFPKLEYSDAVIAARAEFYNAELATFDSRLATAYSGTIWHGES